VAAAFDTVRRSTLDAARRALPQRCALCAGHSGAELVCAGCVRGLPRIEDACPVCALPGCGGAVCGAVASLTRRLSDATLSAFAYAFPVDRLIQAFKYHGRLARRWVRAAIVAARVQAAMPNGIHIVHAACRAAPARAGFNQAAEIARAVAQRMGLPVLETGVDRIRATAAQADLPWAERAANVRGAFACTADLSGMTVGVVDDVMTAGATLAEFARTLKAAGATRVENWVVARTPPPSR
jgi:predicted amidophosphoribosyltransferase